MAKRARRCARVAELHNAEGGGARRWPRHHDGMAQSTICGRQRGDATGRHEAALARCSRRRLARITPMGESVGAEEGDRFGRVSGAVAGRA
jgi:hypothetical protein